MSFRYYVGPEGPHNARIAVCAEKGAWDEAREKRPLIGRTGMMARNHLRNAGLDVGGYNQLSQEVWLTNAVHYFDNPGDNPTPQDIIREQPRLYEELASMPNLNCIIAMGNAALMSLSNFHYNDIGNRRGSKLMTPMGIKMVPTFHPSFYVRGESRFKAVVQFDVNRAAKESNFPELHIPERYYHVEPNFGEVIEWLDYLESANGAVHLKYGPALSFDLETVRAGRWGQWYITCIGLAMNPKEGFSIPFIYPDRSSYWSLPEEEYIWLRLAHLLNRPDRHYVTQNGDDFDCTVLRLHGITTRFMQHGLDTRLAHALLAPDLPHDLAFIDSIYTSEPYYKDESGRWEKYITVPFKQFAIYNCKDACTTLEAAVEIERDLRALGMVDYFYDHVQAQWPSVHELWRKGFRVDRDRLRDVRDRLIFEVKEAEQSVIDIVGYIPNTKSNEQMGKALINLGVRLQYTTSGRPKIAEEVLMHYANQNLEARQFIMKAIEITKRRTLMSNFLQMTLDSEDFYHPHYGINKTKTGRMASSGADEGGPQLQNIPPPIRVVFIPDRDGDELTKADLSQAEGRVIAWDAQDLLYIDVYTKGLDAHRLAALMVYRNYDIYKGVPPKELLDTIPDVCTNCARRGEKKCSHSERYICKRLRYAFYYNMGARKAVMEILPEVGVFMPESEGQRVRSLLVTLVIKQWQDRVLDSLRRSPILVNLTGRKREFYGNLDDGMLREALSWSAQSVIGDITNDAKRRAHEIFEGSSRFDNCRICTETHDSLTITNPRSRRDDVIEVLNKAFYRPMMIHGRELNIPFDIEHGPNWAEKHS